MMFKILTAKGVYYGFETSEIFYAHHKIGILPPCEAQVHAKTYQFTVQWHVRTIYIRNILP